MAKYSFPEACKRIPCPSILYQRIDRPETDIIGYRWPGSQLSQVIAVIFGGRGQLPFNIAHSASLFVATERVLSTECVTKLNFRRPYYKVMM